MSYIWTTALRFRWTGSLAGIVSLQFHLPKGESTIYFVKLETTMLCTDVKLHEKKIGLQRIGSVSSGDKKIFIKSKASCGLS